MEKRGIINTGDKIDAKNKAIDLLEKCKHQDKDKIPIIINQKTIVMVKKGLSKKKIKTIKERYSSLYIKPDSII